MNSKTLVAACALAIGLGAVCAPTATAQNAGYDDYPCSEQFAVARGTAPTRWLSAPSEPTTFIASLSTDKLPHTSSIRKAVNTPSMLHQAYSVRLLPIFTFGIPLPTDREG